MIERFDGFSADTFQFLRNLRDNNRREWFVPHKQDYLDHLLKPLQALVTGLGPFMLSIDPDFDVQPAVNGTISRIYRDIRFSRDKTPYRTSHWIAFQSPRKEWQDYPAYYFEISPDSYRYGMGFYRASRETMDRFRASIDSNPDCFLSALAFYPRQKAFAIEGEEYKRPLKADLPKELRDWYNRKNLHLVSNRHLEGNTLDKKLIQDLMHGFKMIAPFYHYLCKVAA